MNFIFLIDNKASIGNIVLTQIVLNKVIVLTK